MNTTSDLLILDEAPQEGKRTDTIHASIIGVMVFSVVFHAIIGLIIYALVDIPEIKGPDQEENVVHHVTLNSPKPEIKPETSPPEKAETAPIEKVPAQAVTESKSAEEVVTKPAETEAVIPYIKELEVSKPEKNEAVSSTSKSKEKAQTTDDTASKPDTGKTKTADPKDTKGVVNYKGDEPKQEPNISEDEKAKIIAAIKECLEDNYNRILSLWVKPRDFPKRISGVIKITLNARGDIIDTRISKSSGDFALDFSVLEAIKRAKRFSPPSIGKLPKNFNFEYDSDMR